MIRKSLSILFILLANIILLVHAVIPHHSHQSEVCIGDSHMQDHRMALNNCSNHNHSNEQEVEDCALNQVVVIRSQQLRTEIKCFDCVDNFSQKIDIQSVLLNKSFDPLFSINILNHKPPVFTSIYFTFVCSSVGLRAPPVV